jgi:cell division protein FtsQ
MNYYRSEQPSKPGESGSHRADSLRQRRTQQTNQRVSTAASRATRAEEARPLRPVTVRNTTFGTPVSRRVATTNPRRQYYLSLDTPGAELRLPAMPRLRPGPRLLSGFLALVCLVGILSMLFSSLFILGAPVVKGLQRLTQADIEAALDIANFNAVEVNATELSTRLIEKFDILESAQVSIGLPNQVSVNVKERSPIIAWQTEKETRWADTKGFLFTPAGDPVQLLTITSPDQPPLYVTPEQMQAIQSAETALVKAEDASDTKAVAAAQAELTQAKNPQGIRQIDLTLLAAAQKLVSELPEGTTLVYSFANGLGWQDAGGWDVYIGTDLTNFDQKIALYQSSIEQLNGQGITPAVISVEYLAAPYYRLER